MSNDPGSDFSSVWALVVADLNGDTPGPPGSRYASAP